MKTSDLYDLLCEKIPKQLCCEWDNDGLSVLPCINHESKKILFALDLRNSVIDYAEKNGFDTIITHHPLIFSPLTELSLNSVVSAKAARLIRSDIAAMSFHTRFDIIKGGTNDVLCDLLGLSVCGRFGEDDVGRLCKIEKTKTDDIINKVKTVLKSFHFCFEKARDEITAVAVCTGSGSDMSDDAIKAGAELFITGEMKYHEMTDAKDKGLSVICAGHYETEFPALKALEKTVLSTGDFITEIYDVL